MRYAEVILGFILGTILDRWFWKMGMKNMIEEDRIRLRFEEETWDEAEERRVRRIMLKNKGKG